MKSRAFLLVLVVLGGLASPASALCPDADVLSGPLRHLDTLRSPAWVEAYDGPGGQLDTARDVEFSHRVLAVAPDGRTLFVTGMSFGAGTHYDFATLAYDTASGDRRWLARYDGPAHAQDIAYAIETSSDGRFVFVTGESLTTSDPLDRDFATVAYDAATGQVVWTAREHVSLVDRAWSLAVSPDGDRVFVTGDAAGDIRTVAYRAETGEKLWTSTYEGPTGNGGRPRMVRASASTVFVAGYGQGTGTGDDHVVLAYDAETGDERWAARYDRAGGSDWAYGLALSPDGARAFVTGFGYTSATHMDVVAAAYDGATGARVWTQTYDGPPGGNIDVGRSIVVSPDGGRVVVAGYGFGCSSSYDFVTLTYDAATGTPQWTARYNGVNGNNSDDAQGLAIAPDGATVYVTGESPGGYDAFVTSTQYDAITVAYDAATGAERWTARYDGPEHFQDAGFAIAPSPDGRRVFVAGERWHSSTPGVGDYLVLAYETS